MDEALEFLQKYDYGDNVKDGKFGDALKPIETAILESHGDAAARKAIEEKLIGVLKSDASRNGKDYCCRQLRIIGTDASVPTLSSMLGDENHSHMARYALQNIPGDAASKALVDALGGLKGDLKAGVIGSLGARGDNSAVAALGELVGDKDGVVARSAALALGAIGTADAAKALGEATPNEAAASSVLDSSLTCAESLLAAGKKADALAIYKKLSKGNPAKHIKLAATRGMLACAGK